MDIAKVPAAGLEPGLRFACLLDGRGGCRALDWAEVRAWKPRDGVLWVHLERVPAADAWLRGESHIDPLVCEALMAEESRPRVEDINDGILAMLRGINRTAPDQPIELVPIHVWVEPERLVSIREAGKNLDALREIREALHTGQGPTTAGRLLVKIAQKSVKYLEDIVGELDDEVDRLDEELHDITAAAGRERLGDLRRRALQLRRYLAPQREAMFRLQGEESICIDRRDRVHLREAADRLLRYIETLDAVRDRATILHEDLAAVTGEQIAKTSYRFTAIAGILLPPSLVAGMLGANVGGIPGNDQPFAFVALVALIALMFPLEIWLLKRIGWI